MVEVSIEVRSGATRFSVAVQAEGVERAVSLVAGRYPGGDCGVEFPIDPERFFVKDPTARPEMIGIEQSGPMAA
jgi:hypothetical protein